MKKLVKGSKAAKDFMAKIRAKRKTKKAPKKAAVKKAAPKKAAPKKAAAKKTAQVEIGALIKLSIDEKKFLITQGKKSKGFKYRAKILWGDPIVLKEKENGQPVEKFIIDNFETAAYLADQLNKGQNFTKLKTKHIK